MTTEQPGVSAMSAELGAVAEVRDGCLCWHIPHPTYAAPQRYRKGRHLLYSQDALDADSELMWRALKALEWTAQPVGVMADEARQVIAALQARLGHPTPALCGPQGPHQQGPQG